MTTQGDFSTLSALLHVLKHRIAELSKAESLVDLSLAPVIRNIVRTAEETIRGAEVAIKHGDADTAYYCYAFTTGAAQIIVGLVTNPNDPLLQVFAEDFKDKAEK